MSIHINRRALFLGLIPLVAISIYSCEGPTGPGGAAGSPGISGLQIKQLQGTAPGNSVGGGNLNIRVECPTGTKAIAGGFSADGDGSQFVAAYQSYPISPTAWQVSVHNGYVGPIAVTAYATCVVVS